MLLFEKDRSNSYIYVYYPPRIYFQASAQDIEILTDPCRWIYCLRDLMEGEAISMALRYEMGGEPSYNNELELVRISRSIKRWSLASLIVGVVIAAATLCLITSGESLSISDAENSVGTEKEDWWIEFPNSGSEVNHPEWVLDALREGPVLLFDHSTNCVGCIDQGNDIDSVLEDFEDDEIVFYDIIAGEDDSRGYELFYIYEPNGLIPLTILLTLVQDSDGDVVVGWHGVVGATGEEWIRSYVEDAIIYYDENSENWNK